MCLIMTYFLPYCSAGRSICSARLLSLIALDTIVGERGALHLWRLRGEKNRLDEQNFRMQKENEVLRERVYRLRNDNAFLKN